MTYREVQEFPSTKPWPCVSSSSKSFFQLPSLSYPDPPHTHLKKHLKQLFFAHIIFGISSALAYQLLENVDNPGKDSVLKIN